MRGSLELDAVIILVIAWPHLCERILVLTELHRGHDRVLVLPILRKGAVVLLGMEGHAGIRGAVTEGAAVGQVLGDNLDRLHPVGLAVQATGIGDRKSTRLNSS